MRIAVCIKWSLDSEHPFRASPEGIDVAEIPCVVSPSDLVACEAALRLNEAAGGTVSVFTAGPDAAEKAVREGLALGADEGTLVVTDAAGGATSRLLGAAMLRSGAPDLVLCAPRSIDSGSGAVPAGLARKLGACLVSNVVRVQAHGGGLEVERRIDGGAREVLHVELPAVVAVEPTLCQPRYPTLLARRRAQNASISVIPAAELETAPRPAALVVAGVRPPRPRNASLVQPPPEMAAKDRIRFILAGGIARSGNAPRLDGAPESVVESILEFLKSNGFVPTTG